MSEQENNEDAPIVNVVHFTDVNKIVYSCVRAICAEVPGDSTRTRPY